MKLWPTYPVNHMFWMTPGPSTSTRVTVSPLGIVTVGDSFVQSPPRPPPPRVPVGFSAEKAKVLEEIGEENAKKVVIQRSKGLGENDPEMMNMTTMNPKTRRLIKVEMEGAENTFEMFNLLLGDNLQGRKDYITSNGHLYLDDADLM